MKKWLIMMVGFFALLVAQMSFAAEQNLGIVDVTQLFNNSSFVKKANQKLQADAKTMEAKVKAEQKILQDLVSQFEGAKSNKKISLQKKISDQQAKITQMTQTFQQQIKEKQEAGLQQFNTLVRNSVAKIAKEKQLTAVLSTAVLLYTDGSLVDITKDVEAAMQ